MKAEHLVERLLEEARANADARRAHAGRYLLQTLANAAAITREGDAATLFGAFPRTPAIIVGAGPSLDGSLEDLKTAADRALVIACSAAARPLLGSGISPRFIVSVDPSESNGMHLAGLPSSRGSWLVGEGSLWQPVSGRLRGIRQTDIRLQHQRSPPMAVARVPGHRARQG